MQTYQILPHPKEKKGMSFVKEELRYDLLAHFYKARKKHILVKQQNAFPVSLRSFFMSVIFGELITSKTSRSCVLVNGFYCFYKMILRMKNNV